MSITKVSFVAAPALMAGYGVVRLLDTRHGPGFAWTFGHLLMLAGLILFGWVFDGLRRAAPGRIADVLAGVAYLGLGAVIVQISIDIVVGLLASDTAEKHRLFDQVQAVPGVLPVVYSVVPLLFYVGLLALTVRAAVVRPRPVPWWTPVLIVAGTVAGALSLDLIPAAAILFLLALLPLALRTARVVPVLA